jgi:hypothetical protein
LRINRADEQSIPPFIKLMRKGSAGENHATVQGGCAPRSQAECQQRSYSSRRCPKFLGW